MNTLLMVFDGFQPIIDAPLWGMLLLKVTAILFAAWLGHLALLRSNPRWRVLLWRVTAVGMIVLPAVTWLLPALEIHVQQPPSVEIAAVPTTSEITTELTSGADIPIDLLNARADSNLAGNSFETEATQGLPVISNEQPQVDESITGVSALPRPETLVESSPASSSFAWPPVLAAVWICGIAVLGLRLCVGHYRIMGIARGAVQAPQRVHKECMRVARAVGCRRSVEVVQSSDIPSPFLCGLRRPLLLLPGRMCDDSYHKDLPGILAHELSHARSHDVLWNAGLQLLAIVLWFHPLAWQMRKAHLTACELVSDATSANFIGNVSEYCRTLARVAIDTCESLPASGIAMARTSAISRRMSVLKHRVFHMPLRRRSVLTFGTVAFLGVAVIGAMQFALAETPTTIESASTAIEEEAKQVKDVNATPVETPPQLEKRNTDNSKWQAGQILDFRVINAKTKEPLPGVKLDLQFHGKGINFQDIKTQTTDAQGRSIIRLPDLRPDAVRVYPSKPGFVPLRVYWGDDLPTPKLPKSVTVPMQPGTVWGGIVKNEKGQPIPGVKVNVRYLERCSEFNPHLRVNIDDDIPGVTTDKDGRWRMDILPEKFSDEGPRLFLTHADYVSDHLQRGMTPMPVTKRPSIESLRDQTSVMVMRKGGEIKGRVVDEKGRAVAGARVYAKEYYWLNSGKPTATTDNEGLFRIANLSFAQSGINNPPPSTMRAIEQQKVALIVQAKGYSPQLIHANPDSLPKPLEISLNPGQTVHGRVVDEGGKPLAGVSVSISNWLGYRDRFNLTTKTDADGKFRLSDAPLSNALYSFSKKGYMRISDFPMLPQPKGQVQKEGYLVTLKSPLRVAGSIVDAETNKPPTKCKVIKGIDFDDGRAPEWQQFDVKTITDGRYEFEFAGGVFSWRIRVEADGYMPAISRLFKPGDSDKGRVTFDFKLSKAASLTGTVLNTDGKPLAAAEVFLATNLLAVKDGKVPSQFRRNAHTTKSDAAGRFDFPPEIELFYIVVLHEQGFAVVNEKQFADKPAIRIQPWTADNRNFRAERRPSSHRVKSAAADAKDALLVRVVDLEDKPVEGAHVSTFMSLAARSNRFAPHESNWRYSPNILSDRDGMASIPVKHYNNCIVSRHVERKLVAIQSINPEQVKGTDPLTLTMHPQCKISGILTAKELKPSDPNRTWSFVYLYLNDGRGRPMICSVRDGDFHFYAPPGTYILNAYSRDTQHVRKTITVKPGQTELDVKTINLPPTGLVLLKGKPAPELRDIIAWKNGGPVKLSDLHGKVVILAFTNKWSKSRLDGIMPEMFQLYDKYHEQGLDVIEIRIDRARGIDSKANLDEMVAEVKKPFWEDRDIPIPIALAFSKRVQPQQNVKAKSGCPVLNDYGIRGLPTAVLIDRQGRVVGQLDRGNADDAMLEKVFQQKPDEQPTPPTSGESKKPVQSKAKVKKKDAKASEKFSIKPGFRPMQIRVSGSDGKPIHNAGITVRGMTSLPFGPMRYRTNAEGKATIEVPKDNVKSYQILVYDDKHVTAGAHWRGDAIAIEVPQTFAFTLEPGTVFGGIVRNEQGKPVAGAKVTVNGQKRSLPDNPRWVSINDTATTDAAGKWRVNRMPKDLKGFDLAIKIKRPDIGGVERFDKKELAIDKLRNQTAIFVLRGGVTLEGTVTDPQGKPAVDADMGLFSGPGGGDYPRTKTDNKGRYRFAVSRPGEYTVAAAAAGYAPDSKRVTVATASQTIDLQLSKGEMIRLRVVDEEGRPMPAVTVSTLLSGGKNNALREKLMLDYESTIRRTKKRNFLTDAEGRWSRRWIVGDELTFNISKKGYAQVMKKYAPDKQEQVITLEAGDWSISGRVVDSQTKAPVTEFRIVEGNAYGNDHQKISWYKNQSVTNADGRFHASWDTSGSSHRVLRIEADGYLPSEPRRLKADERQVTFDVALNKGQQVTGVVRTADGKPLADAEVALCTASRGLYLKNGRPMQGQPHLIVRTGADGRFSLPPQRELFFLVVLHDKGFAQVEDQSAMKEITLQPWAKAEGTLKVGDKPGAREDITINFSDNTRRRRNPRPGELENLSEIERTVKMIEIREIPLTQIPKDILDRIPKATIERIKNKKQLSAIAHRIHFDYSTQTDADGRFAFDRVRPGKATIGRSITISLEGQMSSRITPHKKSVEFVSGQTLNVDLSGPKQSVIRQRELTARKLREQRIAAAKKQNDPERETRIEAALKVLLASPPAKQDARIEAALEIVGNLQMGKNEKSWATAIRELITIGKPAIPKLIEKLDHTKDNKTLRDLGYVLRGIGDPRAIPALIRAIPRTYPGGGSDCGLVIQGDPELHQFMHKHDNSPRDGSRSFSYGRPIREIMPALEKITGESHAWMELNFADHQGQGAAQDRMKHIAFLNHAKRWADWWAKNWKNHVSSKADAQLGVIQKYLDQYAEAISKMPHRAGLSEIPCGPNVFVGSGFSNHRIRSFDEPLSAKMSTGILDFDSGRRPNPPQEIFDSSPGGKPSKKLLAWAEQEGVDLIITKNKLPGSDKQCYAFMPLGMKVWRIDNDYFENLQQELSYVEKCDFAKPWNQPLAQIDEKSGKFDDSLTASYLFITKEGICGAIQLQSLGGWRCRFIYELNLADKK